MSADPACPAPQAPAGAVPRTCVPFAHVPAVPVVAVPYVPVPVPSGLPVLSVAGILPDRTGNVDVSQFLDEWAAGPLTGKADKAPPSAAGSLAALDASGNLLDSGATPASIKAAAVAAVVANAPGTMDTLKEIADILGSSQQAGTVLKRILDLESGKVTVDDSLSTPGAAADAKAVGDAFSRGFTEWVVVPSTGPTGLPVELVYEFDEAGKWSLCEREDVEGGDPVYWPFAGPKGDRDSRRLVWEASDLLVAGDTGFEASRVRVAPTKTSQLTNDGDGTNAFVKTNDTRLSDARTPTAHHATHATNGSDPLVPADIGAASLTDLPYRLVELGKWEFSDGVAHVIYGPSMSPDGWYYSLSGQEYSGYMSQLFSDDEEALDALVLNFSDGVYAITATRASLPGHLLDRAGNRVVVTGDSTLTLPAAVAGHLRDFIVRLDVSGSRQVSFSPSSGVAYTGYGNPSGTYSAGTHLLRFTETAEGEFCVTDMLAEYADASALPYALVSKTPVSGAVSLSDRAVNLVNPTVTELPPVWEWSDGLDHGQPVYGVVYDDGWDYQEYAWGFQGEGDTPSSTDSFGYNYSFVYDGPDATELSFYNSDTYETIVASLVTRYETDVSSLSLPPAVTGKSRDFMVRLAMPENAVMFSWPSGVEYETEDGQMPDMSEAGTYLLAFTESSAGSDRFELFCRKVQGVE